MKISKDVKELILWKLDTEVPPNLRLSVGSEGTFTKEELKKEIKRESKVGQLYVEMQLKFIKSLISGEVSSALAKCA